MRFNQPSISTTKKLQTTNYEGGLAFKHKDPESELYARVATCLVKEPKFYGDKNEEFDTIVNLVNQVIEEHRSTTPHFVLNLAVYARNTLHLRSIPIALLGLSALNPKGKTWVRRFTPSIIKRADELAEIISFVKSRIGNIGSESPNTMLPMSLKKGLQDAFSNFSEYHFAKYDRNNADISMRDVIRLVHPKPETEEQQALYRKIAKGELDSADTWETLISGKGSTKENWEQAAQKMPIMATLRNLRNLLDNSCSHETFDDVIRKLIDEKTILNSKQFPFRFLSAYRNIENNGNPQTGRLLTALDMAMNISIKNIPRVDGTTAIFTDNSGSMSGTLSGKSTMRLRDVGSVMGAIASVVSSRNIIGAFANEFKTINFSGRDSVLTRAEKINHLEVGGATYAHLAFDYILDNNIKVDRIFLFSDMQCYNDDSYSYYSNNNSTVHNAWKQYKARVNPNCYLYSFDLTGYGTTQVPETDPRVLTIGGWSESILKYVPYFETDKQTVLEEIRKIQV